MRLVRAMVWVSAVLVLVVNGASAYVRLAQQGVGCEPWPQCYGRTAPQDAGAVPAADSPHFYVRATHRLAASLAGVLFLAITFLGWNAWRSAAPRVAAIKLLVLAAFLAWLGRYTPSLVPAVTIGNVVAGMATFGVLAWLAAWRPDSGGTSIRDLLPRGPALLISAALGVAVIQIALGALANARYVAAACEGFPSCGGAWWPHAGGAGFDIFTATAVPLTAVEEAGRQAVQLAHRLGAVFFAALAVAVAVAALRRANGPHAAAILLLALVAGQVALGAVIVSAGAPLATAVAHNVISSLVLGTLAWLHSRAQQA
ncbi:MAG: COX15/CtaA family protein [Betaproteobacteria bacterium]|nr:COX15/CtaA family protein [Betaproteobacteria bacterium]